MRYLETTNLDDKPDAVPTHQQEKERAEKIGQLSNLIRDPTKVVFLLIFMNGCTPCDLTKPEWKKITTHQPDVLKKNDDIVVASIEQSLLKQLPSSIPEPSGFPTILCIRDGGKTITNYEKDRTVKAFVKWIQSNIRSSASSSSHASSKFNKIGGKRQTHQRRQTHRRRPRKQSRRRIVLSRKRL